MLTKFEEKNRTKAHKYWPDLNEPETYGEILVTLLETNNHRYKDIIIRKFKVQRAEESLEINQLHYTGWPDMFAPNSTESMQELIKEVDIRKKSLKDPIVVHCSAGIGRTGSFIAIHMNWHNALDPKQSVNIKDSVIKMRKQRKGMVQSPDQYIFVYEVLEDLIEKRIDFGPAKKLAFSNPEEKKIASINHRSRTPTTT